MPLELNTALRELPGVGQARAKALAKLGLETAGDLLAWYPRGYEDRRQFAAIPGNEGRGREKIHRRAMKKT